MRVFAAIPIEGGLREKIGRKIRKYREEFPEARWISKENLHLTLRFIGEVPESSIKELVGFIDSGVSGLKEKVQPLMVSGFGGFEGKGRAVFWIGLKEEEWLKSLAERLSGLVAGCVGEERHFRPHITICRFRIGKGERGRMRSLQSGVNRHGIVSGTQSKLR